MNQIRRSILGGQIVFEAKPGSFVIDCLVHENHNQWFCVWVSLFAYNFTLKMMTRHWPAKMDRSAEPLLFPRNPPVVLNGKKILRIIAFYIFGLLFTDAVLHHLEVGTPNCCELLEIYFGSAPWNCEFLRKNRQIWQWLAMCFVYKQIGWKITQKNIRHKAICCCWYVLCIWDWFLIHHFNVPHANHWSVLFPGDRVRS